MPRESKKFAGILLLKEKSSKYILRIWMGEIVI